LLRLEGQVEDVEPLALETVDKLSIGRLLQIAGHGLETGVASRQFAVSQVVDLERDWFVVEAAGRAHAGAIPVDQRWCAMPGEPSRLSAS
jgi:hypothetical protein